MNNNIRKLHAMASSDSRMIIGLMSGTSLDGLDIALCKVSGAGRYTQVSLIAFQTTDYSDEIKNRIKEIFAKETINFPYMAMLNEWIGLLHGEMINEFLEKNKIDHGHVDLIASHGQTVMHAPKHQHMQEGFPNTTLQIGDGDHISVKTGIITVSDFRQKHLAAGGEGAPLAVYGDYLIFSEPGEDRIMLNMGGIGNFTYLPGDGDASKVFVTDTGPGNTLMDAFMKKNYNLPFDKNAQMASKGMVNNKLVQSLKDHYFFRLKFPKTTGPEVFNLQYVHDALEKENLTDISHEDIMATLNILSAETITDAIRNVIGAHHFKVYMSGGGAHNPLMVASMKCMLPECTFSLCDELGISGDAKEAVLFAVLANETIAGNPVNFGSREGVPSVCMGKISFPE